MAEDRFAKIAAGYKTASDRGLKPIEPSKLPDRRISLSKGDAFAFSPYDKINTKEQLYNELEKARKYYKPFLENHAPDLKALTRRTEITDFTFSLDNGEEESIKIPYYSGPTGKHTAVYKSEFEIEFEADKSVFICFKGVDYIAEVFVNDVFAGRHEGFFAPFELDITNIAKCGKNTLKVIVRNDNVMMGNANINGEKVSGDKVYAATGLGWDDPLVGWHHCPPGFGIYNKVFVEVREKQFISDIFPRVNSNSSEIWVECFSTEEKNQSIEFEISVYGQNFKETVIENMRYTPVTYIETGVGDTLTEAQMIAEGKLGAGIELLLGPGYNKFIIPIEIKNRKIWESKTPYLYQTQIKMYVDGKLVSAKSRQFGIRDFTQDLNSLPKGKFYLNGKEIRLYGANTMGYEQQDVLRGDFSQLTDDMLLAKLCNMNFLRLTQRPVQEEIYDICDKLGLMIQTDMPLFGTIRINQYCETLRQTEEMEKLVRSHPSCIIDSYINEPFPNSSNMPHRMISRKEMMNFFDAADSIVKMNNPDRVTKHVDGDYDPPSKLMPDNHCYTMWYNSHGIDMGKLHKGYWLDVMPGWHCGCGEFGAEGLDFAEIMKSDYPKEWLKEPFDPNNIINAQTGPFHYFFYETPHDMDEWVSESHRHQAFATKIMTSALRRNPYINTFAIHLFIDAWPSGWMKTIMDCKRNPKPAFFTYMDCLSPVFCSLRTDRFKYFGGESVRLESYVVSDCGRPDEVLYMAEMDGKIIYSGKSENTAEDFIGYVEFKLPEVTGRTQIKIYSAAVYDGEIKHYSCDEYEIWEKEELKPFEQISYSKYDENRQAYDEKVKNGEKIIIGRMESGAYKIGDCEFSATDCQMGSLYVVSRDTGHKATEGLKANDLSYMYDSKLDRLAPLIHTTIKGNGLIPVVTSGNREDGEWEKVIAVGEIPFGKGKFIVNQLDIENKTMNPPMVKLLNKL